jgi:hypothetical protein
VVYADDKTWCETLRRSIEIGRLYRNVYLDVVRSGANGLRDDWFLSDLTALLEHLLPYQFTPESRQSFYKGIRRQLQISPVRDLPVHSRSSP